MARYFRIRGPASTQSVGQVLAAIAGMTTTQFFDDGELLLIGRCQYRNQDPAVGTALTLAFLLDGVQIPTVGYAQAVLPLTTTISQIICLEPISSGQHTIALAALETANVADQILAGTAELIIAQLPLWAPETNLITL